MPVRKNSPELEHILSLVETPARYIGGEVHTHAKDPGTCALTFALAFPDVYEVGMSHTGLQILYAVLNGDENIAAERVFAPWPDMEGELRARRMPLVSLENSIPLSRFDIVGFSLQYELSATNILTMLELGGIPIESRERRDGDPIVIAGGPGAFNPEPMARFIDAFAIGEGEEVALEISRAVMEGKRKGRTRRAMLTSLADIGGVYVPSVHRHGAVIEKRVIADLDRWTLPDRPIVPLIRTIHDRITLEIARGCTRGCRFCQAGMVWRPARERSPDVLRAMADRMLRATGWDELSLLSLSAGDYSLIEPLLSSLMNRYCAQRIALALPSLRVETLTPALIDEIRRVRKTSFTLAPEAGTQRLRNIINKGNTEEDLAATVRRVFDAGWRTIKLYFMIGLPHETPGDIEGIADLALRLAREAPSRGQITVSLSTFVPKPHTPFQWHRQLSIGEVRDIQDYLKKAVRHRNLGLKWHDARMSYLEGLISRGDGIIGELIAGAYRRDCRFDGWSDQFRFDLWQDAIDELCPEAGEYLGERSSGAPLPWDYVDCGVTREYLLNERDRAAGGETTADCRYEVCTQCGACAGERALVIARENAASGRPSDGVAPESAAGIVHKYRLKFAKSGAARFLSHLDTASALTRAVTRSGLAFAYSEGFHPHPRISFPHALPVGMESLDEHVDMELGETPGRVAEMKETVNAGLPAGLEILDIREIPRESRSVSNEIRGFSYTARLTANGASPPAADIVERIEKFLRGESFVVTRVRKGIPRELDIRPLVGDLAYDAEGATLRMTLHADAKGNARPFEILTHVIGLDDRAARTARVVKTGTELFGRTSADG